MNPALIASLITNIVIPEVTSFIRSKIGFGQPMPTDAEVIANLQVMANSLISVGQAWLDAHPKTPAATNVQM